VKNYCIYTIISVLAGFAFAQNSFQMVSVSAKSTALGSTGTADADNGFCPMYNPALLSEYGKFMFGGGNQFLALDRKLFYATISSEIKGGAGVGLCWTHTGVSNVEGRDFDGNITGTVENSTDAIYFGFGKSIYREFHFGIGVEYVQSSIENVSTSTAGFSGGLSARIPGINLELGASVQNLFMSFSWNSNDYYGQGITDEEKFPILYRAGAKYSFELATLPFEAYSDLWKCDNTQLKYGLGLQSKVISKKSPAEPDFMPELFLRAGFSNGLPAGGLGLDFIAGKRLKIGFNYAISAEKESLSPRHIVELIVNY
jgi:hypothetical protein